jgi:hypothetical protein
MFFAKNFAPAVFLHKATKHIFPNRGAPTSVQCIFPVRQIHPELCHTALTQRHNDSFGAVFLRSINGRKHDLLLCLQWFYHLFNRAASPLLRVLEK